MLSKYKNTGGVPSSYETVKKRFFQIVDGCFYWVQSKGILLNCSDPMMEMHVKWDPILIFRSWNLANISLRWRAFQWWWSQFPIRKSHKNRIFIFSLNWSVCGGSLVIAKQQFFFKPQIYFYFILAELFCTIYNILLAYIFFEDPKNI